jgi:hypothetical protein
MMKINQSHKIIKVFYSFLQQDLVRISLALLLVYYTKHLNSFNNKF